MNRTRQKALFKSLLVEGLNNAVCSRNVDFYYDRIQGVTELRPHETQKALWDSKSRFKLVAAGRGSGKTDLAKRWIVQQLAKRKAWADPRYFYAAPTSVQAKRIAWNDLKSYVPKAWLASPDDIREGDLTIKTRWGSMLYVLGLDKPQRIEGVQWDDCVLDEICDIKPGTFHLSILPALTHRMGGCWRIGVPKRQGIGAAEFREEFEKVLAQETADSSAYTWPSSTVLTKAQLQYAMDNMDPRDFREQFGATFEKAGGGVFYAFDRDINIRPVAYNPELPILVASDFNVDPMCWILCHRQGKGLVVFDEFKRRDTNTVECLNLLHRKFQDHKAGFQFYGDAAANQRRTEATKTNLKIIASHVDFLAAGRTIHYPKANPPVAERFASTNAMFLNAAGASRLFIDPRCKALLQDIQQRYYKKGTMVVEDSGDLGHMTDALGYIIFKLFPLSLRTKMGSTGPAILTGPIR